MPIQLPGSPQLPQAQRRGALSYKASFAPNTYAGAGIRAAGGEGGGIASGIADGISKASNALKEQKAEQDKLALANARSHFLRSTIEAEKLLMEEKDPAKYQEVFDKTVGKARREALGMVQDQRLQELLDIDMGDDYARGSLGVAKLKKAKDTEIGIAGLNENLARNTDSALATNDPIQIARLMDESSRVIDHAAGSGYISEIDRQSKKREFAEKYALRKAEITPPEELEKLTAPKETRSLLQMATQANGGNGKDAATMQRIFYMESRNDPMAVNPLSGAAGPGQFMPETAKQYGITNPHDWQQSITGGAALFADNKKFLTGKLGREPAPFEHYLAWQQGATGAAALIGNPETNAVQALVNAGVSPEKAKKSIIQNGGTEDMTAADFTLTWAMKFGGVEPEDIPIPVFEKTGTWVDVMPHDVRVLTHEKAKKAAIAQRKEALTERKTTITDTIQSIMQETNGQISAVPQSLKKQAVELGVWDSATSFSGRSEEDTLLSLKTMRTDEFQGLDLREYRDRLSASDYESLVTKQAELQSPDKQKVSKMADDAADYYNSKTGKWNPDKKKQKEKLLRFKELAEARFADEVRNGGVPNFKRKQEILNDLMLETTLSDGWFKDVSTLTMKVGDIPENVLQDIESELIDQGIEPTEANVLDYYQRIAQQQ